MQFKYDPNKYIDYLKDDLNNLYENYSIFLNDKTLLNYIKFDNAFERFISGLKSEDVKFNYLESDISDIREYGWSLKNNADTFYERIQSR